MPKRDPRIDAYIGKSAGFARPILTHIRDVVHSACPEVEETLKWGMPYFTYKGMLCGMAAFKGHCTFGFWKGALVVDGKRRTAEDAMGQFGRITKLSELPPQRALAGYVKKAMALNDAGVKAPTRSAAGGAAKRKALAVPADLAAALARDKTARAVFDGFSPSHKREYIEWINEAKRPATRERRLARTLEWLAEGKPRNWKYMSC
jgi:uncharacterized protein YdeI (YjbR/CyaY-like superfamily)